MSIYFCMHNVPRALLVLIPRERFLTVNPEKFSTLRARARPLSSANAEVTDVLEIEEWTTIGASLARQTVRGSGARDYAYHRFNNERLHIASHLLSSCMHFSHEKI